MTLKGAFLALGLAALIGGEAAARCEDYLPGSKPQNTAREFVGQGLDEIVERGWIEFAVYEDFPPWSDLENGEPVGVDIEIGRLIANELGVEARFNLVAAGENLDADLRNWIWKGPVVGGRVANVMLHVPYDSELTCRIEQVVFTGVYYQEGMAIAYLRDAYPEEKPVPAYFRFDTVAVENDSIADFYLSSLAGGSLISNMRRYPSTEAAMAALAAGETAAAMGPRVQVAAGLTEATAMHEPPLPGFSVGSWSVGVAVHQSHRSLAYAIDDAIASALADGRIEAIFTARRLPFSPPAW